MEAFKSQKTMAMRFLNSSVLLRKALYRNLSWGFPFANLLPKTRVLKTPRFRTQTQTSRKCKRFRNATF